MKVWSAVLALALLGSACEFGVVRPPMVRLASGDSVLLVGRHAFFDYETRDTGMVYEYHPFFPLADTVRLWSQAQDVWNVVRPTADTLKLPFVILRATMRTSRVPGVPQPDTIWTYNFVVRRGSQGSWSFDRKRGTHGRGGAA